MLIANTWPISLHFFKLLSQLPSFDPYKNPLRHAEEVIYGHSLQVPSVSQQAHLSTRAQRRGLCTGESEQVGQALPLPPCTLGRTQVNNKIVTF